MDISQLDDDQIRALAQQLTAVVREQNLLVAAQYLADLEDALLEIRAGVVEQLNRPSPVPPAPIESIQELDEGDRILPNGLNPEVVEIDRIHKTGQVVLKIFNPHRMTSTKIILPVGVRLVKDRYRDYTGQIESKSREYSFQVTEIQASYDPALVERMNRLLTESPLWQPIGTVGSARIAINMDPWRGWEAHPERKNEPLDPEGDTK